jgi:hypothetical protein
MVTRISLESQPPVWPALRFAKDSPLAGFRFAPRALLELGKELISSDEVALYELIKNSVDAGTRRIEVEANIVLV